MDDARRVYKYVHLQLGFTEFDTVVSEWDLEEFVLSNKDDMVVLCCVEFVCGICWLGRVTRGMEAIQGLSVEVTGGVLNDVGLQPPVGRHGKRCTSNLFWF